MQSRVGDLELEQDLEFQRKSWRFQRIGWAALALLLLAAFLGLFSSGPLSSQTAGDDASALWIEYERFARRLTPSDLYVHIRTDAIAEQKASFWFDSDYVRNLEVSSVSPQPTSVVADGDRYVYKFDVKRPNEDFVVAFRVRPVALWQISAQAGVAETATVAFTQFVYP